ncbi:hypothetical protein K438DRAFT_1631009, partial [Mycena galopus ATCC 62051]
QAGDYGKFPRGQWSLTSLRFWRNDGIFVREGNIYDDGKAHEFGVAPAVESCPDVEGETWIVSSNVTQVDAAVSLCRRVISIQPLIPECKVAFQFARGCGAVLTMRNETMTSIDRGSLKQLLEDPSMHDMVVVSEVHSCSSYARLLCADGTTTLTLGSHVSTPGLGASASIASKWVTEGSSGNFKSQVNTRGERTFSPLFRLVSLSGEEMFSTKIGQ